VGLNIAANVEPLDSPQSPCDGTVAPSFFANSPHLPTRIERVFQSLCEDLPASAAKQIENDVRRYLVDMNSALHRNEFTDFTLAAAIVEVLCNLLADYEAYKSDHRRLIVGAARYFMQPDDVEPDLSPLGFEDDVQVLNYTLALLHHPELKIDL
jgi:uncharacterized membrane protein YkvA (DUF1232 family)